MSREGPAKPRSKPVTRKVVLTETVVTEVVRQTAEAFPDGEDRPYSGSGWLIPGEAPLENPASQPPGDPEAAGEAVDPGLDPAWIPELSLGWNLMGTLQAVALAAHDATLIQNQGDTLLAASTVKGVSSLLVHARRSKS